MSPTIDADATYRGPRNCDACGKYCMSLSAYTAHYRVHTGERPYSCEICGDTFPQKHHVIRHCMCKHDITDEEISKEHVVFTYTIK